MSVGIPAGAEVLTVGDASTVNGVSVCLQLSTSIHREVVDQNRFLDGMVRLVQECCGCYSRCYGS
jgi:hypothetical protein